MTHIETPRFQENASSDNAPFGAKAGDSHRSLAGPLGVGTLLAALLCPGERAEAQSVPRGRQDTAARTAGQQLNDGKDFMTVADIDAAVSQFRPEVHLYVSKTRGFFPKYPIPENQLKELAESLAGTDYYLFVTADASGYRYDGLRGPQAVTGKLGRELFNDPRFKGVTSDRLGGGHSSASIFSMTIEPRDWWFSGSRELESAGITDEKDWASGRNYGEVGKPDFRAGRFADGVMKTIRAIEADLGVKVAEIQRLRVEAESSVGTAERLFADYQQRLAAARGNSASAVGELFNPEDLPRIQKSLSLAGERLQQGQLATATGEGRALQQELTARIAELVEYPVTGKQLQGLSVELKGLETHPFGYAVEGRYTAAQGVLEGAEISWREGRTGYRQNVERAQGAVRELKAALSEAEKSFTVDGQHIRDLIGQAGQLERSPHAASYRESLENIAAKLVEVQKSWEKKDTAYPELLRVAEGELTRIAAEVLQREQAAQRWALLRTAFWGLVGLGFGGSLAAGFLQHARVGRRREEAEKDLKRFKKGVDSWTTGLHELESLQGSVLFSDGAPIQFAPGSESERHSETAKTALRRLWLFSSVIFAEIISRAEERIAAGGRLSTGNYDSALRILTTEKIEFGDGDEKTLQKAQRAFDRLVEGHQVLTKPFEELVSFLVSMVEVKKEFSDLVAAVEKSLAAIREAREQVASHTESVTESAQGCGKKVEILAEYARGDAPASLFVFSGLSERLGKGAAAVCSVIAERAKIDPVGAGTLAAAVRAKFDAAAEVLSFLEQRRASAVPGIQTLAELLRKNGIEPRWIGEGLKAVSDLAGTYLDRVATSIETAAELSESQFDNIQQSFAALTEKVDRAAVLDATRREKILAAREEAQQAFDAVVAAVKNELGVEPKFPRGKKNPASAIEAADAALAEAAASLSSGALMEAETQLGAAQEAINAGIATVRAVNESFTTYAERVAVLREAKTTVSGQLSSHQGFVEELLQRYGGAILKFNPAQAREPGADETLENNVEEASAALEALGGAVKDAETLFAKGDVLKASAKLGEAEQAQRKASARLLEITDRKEELERAENQTAAAFTTLGAEVQRLVQEIKEDRRVSRPVKDLLQSKVTELGEIRKLNQKARRNPLEVGDRLEGLSAGLESVAKEIDQDRKAHARAGKRIEKLGREYSEAQEISAKIQGDDLPDSGATRAAQEDLAKIGAKIAELRGRFESPQRGRWDDFFEEADDLGLAIATHTKTFDSELETAKRARKAFRASAGAVRKAAGWSGSYGVTIGAHGESELDDLERLYEAGRHDEVIRTAEKVERLAETAIEAAEAEVDKERKKRRPKVTYSTRRNDDSPGYGNTTPTYNRPSPTNDWGGGGGYDGGTSISVNFGGSDGGTSAGGW